MLNNLDKFNPAQRKAITQLSGPEEVDAVAGSGKTTVMIAHVIYLIKHGVDPKHILIVTFTNAATKNAQLKLTAALGKRAKDVYVSTLDSLGMHILHHIRKMDNFVLALSTYRMNITNNAMHHAEQYERIDQTHGMNYRKRTIKKQLHNISYYKGQVISPSRELARIRIKTVHSRNIQRRKAIVKGLVYEAYNNIMKSNQLIDFTDLVYLSVALLYMSPKIRHEFQKKFQYICVDEYQDTNVAAAQMVEVLARKPFQKNNNKSNIFVVGDADQSIYSWRGAVPMTMQKFAKYYHIKPIKMEHNYRSTEPILRAAHSLITKNDGRINTEAWSSRSGKSPIYFRSVDVKHEIDTDARLIHKELKEHSQYTYRSFLILCRFKQQVKNVCRRLHTLHIPCHRPLSDYLLRTKTCQTIMNYLYSAINFDGHLTIAAAISHPRRGIGEKTFSKWSNIAYSKTLSRKHSSQKMYWAAKELLRVPSDIKIVKIRIIQQFMDNLLSLRKYSQTHGMQDTIRMLVKIFHLRQFLKGYGKSNYKALLNIARKFDTYIQTTPKQRIRDFINSAVSMSHKQFNDKTNAVTVMTLHKSKGLQYPVVFINGMDENVIPTQAETQDGKKAHDHEQEERRLCYVAMTRAENRLYLSSVKYWSLYYVSNAQSKSVKGKNLKYHYPSQFIDEIGYKNLYDVPF